ncbi:MAG: hypothetical protein ACE366_04880 [Bradymonadia bacterium]
MKGPHSLPRLCLLYCLMWSMGWSVAHGKSPEADSLSTHIAVFPFTGRQVDGDTRAALAEALTLYLEKGRTRVDLAQVNPRNIEEARSTARAMGADVLVRGRITRLGRRYLVGIEVYTPDDPYPVLSDRMAVDTLEDLDPLARRMAASILGEGTAERSPTLGAVTETEMEPLRRREAYGTVGLQLGGLASFGEGGGFSPGATISWLYDLRFLLFDAGGFVYSNAVDTPEHYGIYIGGYLPFGDGDQTPYIGGGVAVGHFTAAASDTSDEAVDSRPSGGGMSVFGAVGALLGRTSTVQLRGELRYFVSTYAIRDDLAHGMTLGLGLGF